LGSLMYADLYSGDKKRCQVSLQINLARYQHYFLGVIYLVLQQDRLRLMIVDRDR